MPKAWRRKAVAVGDALRDVARAMGWEGRLAEVDILRAWPRTVGRALAERARPVRLEAGRLLIHVADSAALHRLSLMRRDIVRNLNEAVRSPLVKEVRLRIGPLLDPADPGSRAASPRPARRRVPAADPDDPAIRQAMAMVKGLPFEEVLQRILQRQAQVGRTR